MSKKTDLCVGRPFCAVGGIYAVEGKIVSGKSILCR